jgi:multidrug resistance efflux pump
MLELTLCSLLTIFPDYLFRRYVQGRRFGHEITIFSVWFELRWGITLCLMLTITLITIVFFYHPSTTSVTSFFRTVPLLPEVSGRVAEIYVGQSGRVEKGAPLFKLDSSLQEADLETARRRIAETDAAMVVARADLEVSEGQIQQAQSSYKQALDELQTKQELDRRNANVVARREIERLQVLVDERKGGVASAIAGNLAAEARLNRLLPAQKASAEAARAQAQVALDKTVVYAGVTGQVEQFVVRVGDIVTPQMRPAGILIPADARRGRLWAGFGQIEAEVMKVGMTAEVTCAANPFTVVPMVVTAMQNFIAAGQFRAGDQLIDPQEVARQGTIVVTLEPLYEGGLGELPLGSNCIANAYTSNHELLASHDIGVMRRAYLHVVDTVGLVHAMILRIQALLLPIQTLVFKGH